MKAKKMVKIQSGSHVRASLAAHVANIVQDEFHPADIICRDSGHNTAYSYSPHRKRYALRCEVEEDSFIWYKDADLSRIAFEKCYPKIAQAAHAYYRALYEEYLASLGDNNKSEECQARAWSIARKNVAIPPAVADVLSSA